MESPGKMKFFCFFKSFCTNLISTELDSLTRRIEGTFQILFIWIKQNADTFINGNSLERTLIICQSDQIVCVQRFSLCNVQVFFTCLAIIKKYHKFN